MCYCWRELLGCVLLACLNNPRLKNCAALLPTICVQHAPHGRDLPTATSWAAHAPATTSAARAWSASPGVSWRRRLLASKSG